MPSTPPTLADLCADLRDLADAADAIHLQRFFKTGPDEYGAGDRFLGIRMPVLRRLARTYQHLELSDMLGLLRSEWHEQRMLALLLMVQAYRRGDADVRQTLHDAYLAHTRYVNNWDLVDVSAEHLVGAHLDPRRLKLLRRLARSNNLWERRIAILATFDFIRRDEFRPTLEIARLLLDDPHDLIHKAVGWMLREVGKRDQESAEAFLRRHCRDMPRTMLRYAIERFPPELRARYLAGDLRATG